MTQRRVQDYGVLAESSDIKQILFGLARSTVLQGNRFGVAGSSVMRVFSGIAVTNQGVMIVEDEVQELPVPTSTNAQDYTVYYEHVDQDISGGEPAILRIANGILNPDGINGVILGYVKYPGGAVPLSSAHFYQEPETFLKNFIPNRENVDWLIPLKGAGYIVTNTANSALTITDYWDTVNLNYSLKLQNNVVSPNVATATFTMPFKVGLYPYSLLQAKMQVDLGASVEFKLLDSSSSLIDVTTVPLQPQSNFFLYSLSIPTEAIQNSNDLVYLQMVVNLSSTRSVKLQGLGLSTYNLPV